MVKIEKDKRFWAGTVIVLLGLIFFLNNLGFLPNSYLRQLFQLWPLLLVLWGAELLSGKNGITCWGVILTAVILLIVMVFFPSLRITHGSIFNFSGYGSTHVDIQASDAFAEAQFSKGILSLNLQAADLELTAGEDAVNGSFNCRGDVPGMEFLD